MRFWNLVLVSIVLFISSNVNAALVPRLDGLAYYDNEADLTWLADANYAYTSGYSTASGGRMMWDQANEWVSVLDVAGVTGWRLPNTLDYNNNGTVDGANVYQGKDYGYNITAHSELSNMFYNLLGNTAQYDTNGSPTTIECNTPPNFCLTNIGPFINLRAASYWSGTKIDFDYSWYFSMYDGYQFYATDMSGMYAWAVYDGDVSAVPVPAAVWLFGSGLLGLIGVARRKCLGQSKN